ncbi:MAG: hypothetical protein OCC46_09155 [Pseudodesulfovibrio sp.]
MTSTLFSQSGKFRITLGSKIISGADLTKKNLVKSPSDKRKSKTDSPPKKKQPSFSRNSRNNLIKAINSLTELPEFLITLSYPDGVSSDPKEWKKDLNNLARRLKHRYPDSWWIWRIEPQTKTGKPHYHIIGSTADSITKDNFRQWLAPKWCKLVGLDPKEAKFTTRIQEVSGDEGKLERYFSKPERKTYKGYLEGWTKLTNRWGKVNKANIPSVDLDEFEVDQATMDETKELVLGSIQTQIDVLQKEYDSMSNFTPHRERQTIEKSIKAKKKHMYNIRFTGDFFSILDVEHIDLIRQTLEGKRKANIL